MTTSLIDVATLSIGLLVVRVTLGLLMAAHGSQKMFGWFGGNGLAVSAGAFHSMGFRPGRLFAAVASGTEIVSGLLLALGFFGPVGPALMISVMIVAAVTVHWKNGLLASGNGVEMPLLYAVGALGILLTGPGQFSLDEALGLGFLSTPPVACAALVIGVVGGIVNVLARRPAAA